MSTWKNPKRMVWHTVTCPRCNRVINRVKLPGLMQVTSHRVCAKCTSGAPAPRRAPRAEGQQGAPPRRRRGPAPAAAPAD